MPDADVGILREEVSLLMELVKRAIAKSGKAVDNLVGEIMIPFTGMLNMLSTLEYSFVNKYFPTMGATTVLILATCFAKAVAPA